MPRYAYCCSACENIFDVTHGMGVPLTDCEECRQKGTLRRIPSKINLKVKNVAEKEQKPGKKVKKYIEEARIDLKLEKNRLRSQEEKK